MEEVLEYERRSARWLKVFEVTGALTITGGADPNYESASIEIWAYDEVIVDFYLSLSQDMDYGLRFVDIGDNAVLTSLSIRDFDTAAILDIAAIYAVTAVDVKATPKYYQMVLDHLVPKHLLRVYAENDHATDTAGYTIKVYGRILK